MIILAIETSCDETSIALVEGRGGLKKPKFRVIKNLVLSQIKIHAPFGGVVPSLAKREHLKNLPILYQKTLPKNQKLDFVDAIGVTIGPGLEPALWMGIQFAKYLKQKFKNKKIKLIGVNHLEAHLYSFLLSKNLDFKPSKIFPAIALLVSGGHTILLKVKSLTEWKKLGETRDDAVGEAFDKVARLLDLPYPGGPEIEKIAKNGNPKSINFPRPMINQKNYDFSFSGLKTAVLYYLRGQNSKNNLNLEKTKIDKIFSSKRSLSLDKKQIADAAASFQQAAVDILVTKTMRAVREFKAKSIILCGGVASNKNLKSALKKQAEKQEIGFFNPPMKYNTDNAAMVGVAAYLTRLRGKKYKLEAQGNLNI